MQPWQLLHFQEIQRQRREEEKEVHREKKHYNAHTQEGWQCLPCFYIALVVTICLISWFIYESWKAFNE